MKVDALPENLCQPDKQYHLKGTKEVGTRVQVPCKVFQVSIHLKELRLVLGAMLHIP